MICVRVQNIVKKWPIVRIWKQFLLLVCNFKNQIREETKAKRRPKTAIDGEYAKVSRLPLQL